MATTLTIVKDDVYEDVYRTTSYAGAKMSGDDNAYDRISASSYDSDMLDRFWNEACSATTEQLKKFISSFTEGNDYSVELELSSSFDNNLVDSIEASLFSFFVSYMSSKWYKFTNRSDADTYEADAAKAMDDVMSKIYFKKKPTRTAITPPRPPRPQV